MPIERVNPDNVYHLKGLSATVKIGNTVHISGQIALDNDMNTVGDDAATQLKQIYKNLDDLCRAHGGSLANMVKTITYITDLGPVRRRQRRPGRSLWRQSPCQLHHRRLRPR